MKLLTGTKRIFAAVSKRSADDKLTVPTSYQFPPLSVEYCHAPCSVELAALADTAIPVKVLLSASANFAFNNDGMAYSYEEAKNRYGLDKIA